MISVNRICFAGAVACAIAAAVVASGCNAGRASALQRAADIRVATTLSPSRCPHSSSVKAPTDLFAQALGDAPYPFVRRAQSKRTGAGVRAAASAPRAQPDERALQGS
jgi:hypothetical protein